MMQQVIVQNNGSAEWDLSGTCKSAEIPVLILNPQGGKSAAVQTVKNSVPANYDGLPLSKIRFDSYDSEGNLSMIAVYESTSSSISGNDSEEESEATMSFSCGGGSMRVTQSLSKQRVVKDGGTDPGYVIGWNGKPGDDSQIAGVDVPTALFRETYTKEISLSKLTTAYKRKLGRLTGTVNNAPWKGWDAGEVMFMGANFSTPIKGAIKAVVSFDFEIHLNEKNFRLDPDSPPVGKKGYEYAWGIPSATKQDNESIPRIGFDGIYIAQVCKYTDFSELGL